MKKLFFLFTICIFSVTSYGQEERSIFKTIQHDVANTAKGIGRFYTSPLRWKKKNYVAAGVIAGGFTAVALFDNYFQETARRHESSIPNSLKTFGDYFGGHVNAFVFSGSIYTTGLLFKHKKIRKTGALMFTSVVAAGSLQTLVKVMVGRARPRVGNSSSFKPFSMNRQYHAFPSGHSAVAMVFVHSIARQTNNTLAKVALYTAGAIVPISRVWAESHHVSDVVLGSVLGLVTVNYLDKYLTNLYEGNTPTKTTNVWRFQPGLANMKLSYTFN